MTCLEKYHLNFPNGYPDDHLIKHDCPSNHGYAESIYKCDGRFSKLCKICWSQEALESNDLIIGDSEVEHTDTDLPESTMWPKENPYISEKAKQAMKEHRKELGIPTILDSGDRTEFPSGAVRDLREGKGRCDLLPLDVVSEYLNTAELGYIANFQDSGDTDELLECLHSFQEDHYFKSSTMFLEVAIHFEEGAKKYGDDNWQKGIPVRCYIDSAVRHYLKFLRGDKDEPHDRAFCWNILCAIWTCKHKPELNDYRKEED